MVIDSVVDVQEMKGVCADAYTSVESDCLTSEGCQEAFDLHFVPANR